MSAEKKITCTKKSDHSIGLPQPGDVQKVHVRGYYVARRPLFEICGAKVLEKEHRIAFVDSHKISDSHAIGDDTAYVSVHVGKPTETGALTSSILAKAPGSMLSSSIAANPTDGGVLGGFLSKAALGMVLGEKATFTYDLAKMDDVEMSLLVSDKGQLCRGHFGSVPEDATGLVLEIESCAVMRDGMEHSPDE